MKKLIFIGEVTSSFLPHVEDALLHLNQKRARIIIALIFGLTLIRELVVIHFPEIISSIDSSPFSFSDIIQLGVLAILFFLLWFFSTRKIIERMLFYFFVGFWVFSISFSLLLLQPESIDFNVALTVFVNIMLINMFFFINPLVTLAINVIVFTSLLIIDIQTDGITMILLFSIISVIPLLFFININQYRTMFFQVYYRIQHRTQEEVIREQNTELEAQNEEIKAQQNSLYEITQRMQAWISNVPGVVYRCHYDADWSMVFISEYIRNLCGYDDKDFLSNTLTFADIIHPDDRETVAETVEKHIEKKQPFVIEYRLIDKTDREKWIREYGRGVPDHNHEIRWIDGVILDIDEEKRIARLREDVERTVRHDLKNPLNGIIGGATILQEVDCLDDEEKEFVSLIKQSGYKILHMINHSLDLFKMEEGTYVLQPKECDLFSILDKVIKEMADSIQRKKLNIVMTCGDKTVTKDTKLLIQGEAYNLESLFSNLISNAIDASPEGKEITVSVRDGELISTHIHNVGAIPEHIRDSFFSRYVTSGKSHGTGLGTYSARLIARAHRGDITFTSSEEDGTTLIVSIPTNDVSS
jgi:PAS domain S-box-containing protein